MDRHSVTVNTGQGNLMLLAAKIIGAPGASASRMIEAALRAYRGDPRDEIIERVTSYGKTLHGGGPKHGQVDPALVENVDNISRAGRIGLAMLTYNVSREEAEEWEAGLVRLGRPQKKMTA